MSKALTCVVHSYVYRRHRFGVPLIYHLSKALTPSCIVYSYSYKDELVLVCLRYIYTCYIFFSHTWSLAHSFYRVPKVLVAATSSDKPAVDVEPATDIKPTASGASSAAVGSDGRGDKRKPKKRSEKRQAPRPRGQADGAGDKKEGEGKEGEGEEEEEGGDGGIATPAESRQAYLTRLSRGEASGSSSSSDTSEDDDEDGDEEDEDASDSGEGW